MDSDAINFKTYATGHDSSCVFDEPSTTTETPTTTEAPPVTMSFDNPSNAVDGATASEVGGGGFIDQVVAIYVIGFLWADQFCGAYNIPYGGWIAVGLFGLFIGES